MEKTTSENLPSLLQRRKGKDCSKVKRLIVAVPEDSPPEDVDDEMKNEHHFHDWLTLTKNAYSKRPSLAFSPSILLSPLCFSPLQTPHGIVSPFMHLEKQISSKVQLESDKTSNYDSTSIFTFEDEPPTVEEDKSIVFSFDVVSPEKSPSDTAFSFDETFVAKNGQFTHRTICTIPEDGVLSHLDMFLCSTPTIRQDTIQIISQKQPVSPSLITGRSHKREQKTENDQTGSKKEIVFINQQDNNISQTERTSLNTGLSKRGVFSSMVGI